MTKSPRNRTPKPAFDAVRLMLPVPVDNDWMLDVHELVATQCARAQPIDGYCGVKIGVGLAGRDPATRIERLPGLVVRLLAREGIAKSGSIVSVSAWSARGIAPGQIEIVVWKTPAPTGRLFHGSVRRGGKGYQVPTPEIMSPAAMHPGADGDGAANFVNLSLPPSHIKPQAEAHSVLSDTAVASPFLRMNLPIFRADPTLPPGLSR